MPDKFTFKQIECEICKQLISVGGAAYTSHMRSHVRKGEAQEYKQGTHLKFIPNNGQETFIEAEPYAKLGEEPLAGQPKGVWEITDYIKDLSTVTGKGINPLDYFTTSGEGVKKADKLVQDLYSLAVKARAFRDKLKKARGLKKYLETSWEARRLLVKTKEPRPKGDKEDDSSGAE